MSPPSTTLYRRAFVDVCRGYSVGRIKDGTEVYIRHLSHFEHQEYDLLQANFEAEALAQGAQTEAQRLDLLYAKGEWSPAREAEIPAKRDFITRLEDGRRTIPLQSILKSHEDHIAREKAALTKMLTDRARAIGMTTETYASRRLEDYYLVHNLFKNKGLTTLVYSSDAFDSLEDEEVDAIHAAYTAAIEPCSDTNLRKLAAQDLFVSYYSIAGDSPQAFFGRPVCELTYYQVRLLGSARYVKALLDNTDTSKLPPEKRNDPEALEQAHTTQKKMTEMQAAGQTPVGMTSDDLKANNIQLSPLPPPNLSGNDLIKWMRKNNAGR